MDLMRPWSFAILCAVFLSACSAGALPKLDERRDVRLVTYDHALQVDKACRDLGYRALPFPITLIEGCAVYTETHCTIHVRKPFNPTDNTAFQVLGHEALHCFGGDWHNDRQEVHAFEREAKHDPVWDALR